MVKVKNDLTGQKFGHLTVIGRAADWYKEYYPNFPQKLYDAMCNYKVEITD